MLKKAMQMHITRSTIITTVGVKIAVVVITVLICFTGPDVLECHTSDQRVFNFCSYIRTGEMFC